MYIMLHIKLWHRKNKMIGLIILCLTLFFIIFFVTIWKEQSLVLLEELSDEEVYSISDEKLIFFVETSRQVTEEGVILITPRQACAMESAARIHQQHTLYLLYSSPKDYDNSHMYINRTDGIQRELLKYDNLKIKRFDLDKCALNTPYEEWFNKDEMSKSNWPIEHTSDVLRYFTMWKYGGMYLDLDFVIMKNLGRLGSNYMISQTPTELSSGILNFKRNGIGHDFAESCMTEMKNNFKGDVWAHNGPQLAGRVLDKYCTTADVSKMKENTCKGLKVLEPWHVYPLGWKEWNHFFDMDKKDEVLVKIGFSYAIHLWNKLSQYTIINTQDREVAYGVVAKEYCPNVYRKSGIFF